VPDWTQVQRLETQFLVNGWIHHALVGFAVALVGDLNGRFPVEHNRFHDLFQVLTGSSLMRTIRSPGRMPFCSSTLPLSTSRQPAD